MHISPHLFFCYCILYISLMFMVFPLSVELYLAGILDCSKRTLFTFKRCLVCHAISSKCALKRYFRLSVLYSILFWPPPSIPKIEMKSQFLLFQWLSEGEGMVAWRARKNCLNNNSEIKMNLCKRKTFSFSHCKSPNPRSVPFQPPPHNPRNIVFPFIELFGWYHLPTVCHLHTICGESKWL